LLIARKKDCKKQTKDLYTKRAAQYAHIIRPQEE
jgi:hypothetical protein